MRSAQEFAKAVEAYTRSLDADDTNSRVWANRAAARLKAWASSVEHDPIDLVR